MTAISAAPAAIAARDRAWLNPRAGIATAFVATATGSTRAAAAGVPRRRRDAVHSASVAARSRPALTSRRPGTPSTASTGRVMTE